METSVVTNLRMRHSISGLVSCELKIIASLDRNNTQFGSLVLYRQLGLLDDIECVMQCCVSVHPTRCLEDNGSVVNCDRIVRWDGARRRIWTRHILPMRLNRRTQTHTSHSAFYCLQPFENVWRGRSDKSNTCTLCHTAVPWYYGLQDAAKASKGTYNR